MDANSFGTMQGKVLEYFLYIEGVRVPFKSISVMMAQDQGAVLAADLMPLFSTTRFVRGMLVHLFKKEGDREPRLRFFGLLKNVSYEKTDSSRSVRMEAGSLDARWDHMAFAEVNEVALTPAVEHEAAFTADDANMVAAVKRATMGGQMVSVSQAETAYLLDAGAIKTTLSPSDIEGGKYDSWAQLQLLLNNQKVPQTTRDLIRSVLNDASKAYYDTKYATSSKEDGTKLSISEMVELVQKGVSSVIPTASEWKFEIPELSGFIKATTLSQAQAGALSVATRMQDMLMQTIRAAKGDILAGMMQIVVNAYTGSNEYNRLELKRTKLDKAMVAMSVAMPNIEGDIFRLNTEFTALDKHQQTRYGLYELFGAIVSGVPSVARLKDIITTLLNAIFCHISFDPTQMERSIIFHPDMIGLFPPRCNVIFPNQLRSLTYNPNMWAEPTRSLITYGSKLTMTTDTVLLGRNSGSPGDRVFLCDKTDPDLSKINVDKFASADTPNGRIAKLIELSQLLTNEETAKGLLCAYNTVSSPILQRLRHELAELVANAIHQRMKYGTRICHVTGDLIDDVVVGMPIVILDGTFTVYGLLMDASYTIDSDGSVQTSLTIGAPINVFADNVPDTLLWLNIDKLSPAKIGDEVYRPLLGCYSIFSPETGLNSDSPSKMLQAHVSHLLKEFDAASDKRLFVDLYRARSFPTDAEVFKDYHKAASVMYSDKDGTTAYWMGEDFEPYRIGNADQLSRPEKPAGATEGLGYRSTVNRQQIVIDFMKEYYGKPGRFER